MVFHKKKIRWRLLKQKLKVCRFFFWAELLKLCMRWKWLNSKSVWKIKMCKTDGRMNRPTNGIRFKAKFSIQRFHFQAISTATESIQMFEFFPGEFHADIFKIFLKRKIKWISCKARKCKTQSHSAICAMWKSNLERHFKRQKINLCMKITIEIEPKNHIHVHTRTHTRTAF